VSVEEYGQNVYTQTEPDVVNTQKETDKKCPACGGVMDFSPAAGRMVCPYCGTEEEIAAPEEFAAQELDFDTAQESVLCDWGIATKAVICQSCGAQTVYDVNQIADVCPYCGSNQVMEAGDEKIMAPGGVVAFSLDAKQAADKFKSWISRKFFCPKLAKDSARPRAFKGVYVPYWTFDTDTYSYYTGQYGINRQYRDRDGKVRTKTDWYRTSGQLHMFFDDVLVCGSSRQNERMMQGVEPYNTKDVREYRPEYLAGFSAERYSVKRESAWELAKEKIRRILHNEVQEKIRTEHRADLSRVSQVDTKHSNITYKYLLLPVWVSSFTYQGKVYQFAVNGQSGKVSGSTPVSWLKVILTVLAVIAAFILINYMMG